MRVLRAKVSSPRTSLARKSWKSAAFVLPKVHQGLRGDNKVIRSFRASIMTRDLLLPFWVPHPSFSRVRILTFAFLKVDRRSIVFCSGRASARHFHFCCSGARAASTPEPVRPALLSPCGQHLRRA